MALGALVGSAAGPAYAQSGRPSPNQGDGDGISVGGKWMMFKSEDKITGAKKIRFELLANNSLRGDTGSRPRLELFCSRGKLELADFNPGTRLGQPDHPSFSGRPQLEVMVRIDDKHDNHSWNWVNGHFLAMDKGTARGLIGADIFNVEVQTASGRQIVEFSPAGLEHDRVKEACGLTPKKP